MCACGVSVCVCARARTCVCVSYIDFHQVLHLSKFQKDPFSILQVRTFFMDQSIVKEVM